MSRPSNLNVSQAELAAWLGISESAVSRLVRGERKWSLDLAVRAAEFLCCKPSDLLVGKRKDDK